MRSMELFATKVMPHFRAICLKAKYPRKDNAPDPKGYFAWEEGMPMTLRKHARRGMPLSPGRAVGEAWDL